MKYIVVTGGAGYIGKEVVKQLLDRKYKVLVVDKKNKIKLGNAEYVKFDLRTNRGLENLLRGASAVVHLAAEVGGVEFANNYPAKIITNNILIDVNTIKASANTKVKKFVYISSSLVYERASKFPLTEKDTSEMPPPTLSYGLEKLMGESLCKAYRVEHGLNYSICRLFNAFGINSFGENDPHGHVIPDLLSKVKKSNGEVEIWGHKGISRNFTHVKDLASGIVKVLESKLHNETYNLASNKEIYLEEVVKSFWELSGKSGRPKFLYIDKNKKDVSRNQANVSKAKKILGWQSTIKLKDGLSEIFISSLR